MQLQYFCLTLLVTQGFTKTLEAYHQHLPRRVELERFFDRAFEFTSADRYFDQTSYPTSTVSTAKHTEKTLEYNSGNKDEEWKGAVVDLLQLLLDKLDKNHEEVRPSAKTHPSYYKELSEQEYCSVCVEACGLQAKENCLIELQSYGLSDSTGGDRGYIKVNGNLYHDVTYTYGDSNGTRGVDTMILNPTTCEASSLQVFDTYGVGGSGLALANYIKNLPDGIILLGVTMDEPSSQLGPALTTLESVGVPVGDVDSHGKFAFIFIKGFPNKTVMAKSMSGGNPLQLSVRLQGTADNINLTEIQSQVV